MLKMMTEEVELSDIGLPLGECGGLWLSTVQA